jgi:D-sedoheptulose 7-phosphate isomerase
MEEAFLQAVKNHKEALGTLESQRATIIKIAQLFIHALTNGNKLIFMGNGGSAADSQHLAAEFVGRFKKDRPAWAALALSTNTSTISAIGNDFGFEQIFVRQIEALAKPGDIVVGISTSGDSENVIRAIARSKELKITTIGFLGKQGGKLKSMVDVAFVVPSNDTPRIQEMHILAGHILCDLTEQALT